MPRTRVELITELQVSLRDLVSYFPDFRYRQQNESHTAAFFLGSGADRVYYLLFNEQEAPEGFKTLSTDLSAQEFNIFLKRLPAEILHAFRCSLLGTKLELPGSRAAVPEAIPRVPGLAIGGQALRRVAVLMPELPRFQADPEEEGCDEGARSWRHSL
jgi:hypothetical protein